MNVLGALPAFTLRNKTIVSFVTVVLAAWGILAFMTSPRREDPKMRIRMALISTVWPGAQAGSVEELVTVPIEQVTGAMDEVLEVKSTTVAGRSSVFVELEEGVDVDNSWDKLRGELETVRGDLPEGCGTPLLNTSFVDVDSALVAIYQTPRPGETEILQAYTPRELEIFADSVADAFRLIPSVGNVNVYGAQEEVIYIETDVGTWSRMQLTADELRGLLAGRNIVAPGGSIDTGDGRFLVKPSGELGEVEQIERVAVAGAGAGAPVYLDDLGLRVTRGYREPARQIARFGRADQSNPCVLLGVTMKDGHNVVGLSERVRAAIAEMRAQLPADVAVEVPIDQAPYIQDIVDNFVTNLLQAVGIVILVAFLLVGLRLALVIAGSIPIVFLASWALVRVFGVEMEQASIASLIVALGLLVDCAIEVGDNVHRLLEEGYERTAAAVEGARQIAFPVLIATLTTVGGFLPMLWLPGLQGEFVRSLPIVITTTLLLSWLIAMTTTTLAAYWLMRPVQGRSVAGFLFSFVGGGKGASRAFAAICALCLRLKLLVPPLAVAGLVGALSLVPLGYVGTEFFPPAPHSQFVIDIALPEGSPIGKTDALCRRVEALLQELGPIQEEQGSTQRLESFISVVGGGNPRFRSNLNPDQPASNVAQVIVETTEARFVPGYVADLRVRTQADIAGARIVPRPVDLGPPVDSPLGVRILGERPALLHSIADEVEAVFRDTPGAWAIHHTWGNQGYELDVAIDTERADQAGVTNAQVASSLNAFFSGHFLTTYREGEHQVPVYLRLPAAQRRSLDRVREISVEGRAGKVPLDAVARAQADWTPSKISRYQQHRMIEVRAYVQQGELPNRVLQRALPRIKALDLPIGYRLEISGTHEKTVKSQREIAGALAVAMVLIVTCLVINYDHLLKAGMILFMVPLAGIGAMLALYVTGLPLGFMAMLGFLSLAGVVINDDVVLIEFIEHTIIERHRAGEGLAAPGERSCAGLTRAAFRECVVRGSQMRMLPVWLTTLTTVGGLIPLYLSGGPLWQPLAAVIIGGLLLATVWTLFVLPCVYAILVENLGVGVRLPEGPGHGPPLPPGAETAPRPEAAAPAPVAPAPVAPAPVAPGPAAPAPAAPALADASPPAPEAVSPPPEPGPAEEERPGD